MKVHLIDSSIRKALSLETGTVLLDKLLSEATRLRASDIHIEPYQKNFRVRFRIHGDLYTVLEVDIAYFPVLITHAKIRSGMDIGQRRLPQDGRFSYEVNNRTIDSRTSTVPTAFGEKMVLRLLDPLTFQLKVDTLGIEEEERQRINHILQKNVGIFLISGVTGCGKSTTLYSILQEMEKDKKNIMTIEEPIEYRIEGVSQVAVNTKAGLRFDNALRAFLRQDPDVIMVGEIRDRETAQMAIRAAITGHMILGTIHSKDSISAITRLRDLGIEDYLIASALTGIASQRLVKNLCPHCKKEYESSQMETNFINHILNEYQKSYRLFRPIGCPCCIDGYHKRQGIFEIFELNSKITHQLAKGAGEIELIKEIQSMGYKTMLQNAIKLVAKGEVDFSEVMEKIYDEGISF